MPIRIVLAEDNVLLREGVARLITAEKDLDLVATCGDYDELLEAIERESPDVVLTDIRMPPTGTDEGVRLAAALRGHSPKAPLVTAPAIAPPPRGLAALRAWGNGWTMGADAKGTRRR